MPGWFAKLPEMYLLDDYFSDREGSLTQRYKQVLAAVDEKGATEIDKVGSVMGLVAGFTDQDREHFHKHWLAVSDGDFADPGQFFPGVTCRDGYEAEAFAGMLNSATRKACQLGLASDPPRPMAWVWQCAPGTGFVGAGVADGPNAIVMTITTPPYSTNANAVDNLQTDGPARAFTYQLNFSEPIDSDPKVAPPRPAVSESGAEPTAYNPAQRDHLIETGYLDDDGDC